MLQLVFASVGEVGRVKSSGISLSFGLRASAGRGMGLPAGVQPLSPDLLLPEGGSLMKGLRHFLGEMRRGER